MMKRYAVNPLQNWKEKDCVLYLHTTLAPKQLLGAAIGSALVDRAAICPALVGIE